MSAPERRPDRGFTLIDVLVSTSVLGLLVSAMAFAFIVTVRTVPSTEVRVDDARSTRGLATWLSHDTTSAPPYLPEQAEGGIDVSPVASAANNACGAPGTNVLHLKWREEGFSTKVYVANYRFIVNGGEARLARFNCSRTGAGPWSAARELNLTSGLSPSTPPIAIPQWDSGEVVAVDMLLTASSGQQVLVETGSRNPVEFYS